MMPDLETYRLHGKLPRMRRLIDHSLELISAWRSKCKKPYLAWSTGKDSTLCLWLARQVDPNIEVVYFDADSCLPDSEEMIKRLTADWGLNFRRVKTRPILDVLAEHGISNPTIERQTMKATVYEPARRLREEGYDGVIVGIRAEESRGRRKAVGVYGPIFRAKGTGVLTCWPLARWRVRDVWAATIANEIPYNPVYDKTRFTGREEIRVSYWAGETNRTYGRYAWLKYYYPDLYSEIKRRCPDVSAFI